VSPWLPPTRATHR